MKKYTRNQLLIAHMNMTAKLDIISPNYANPEEWATSEIDDLLSNLPQKVKKAKLKNTEARAQLKVINVKISDTINQAKKRLAEKLENIPVDFEEVKPLVSFPTATESRKISIGNYKPSRNLILLLKAIEITRSKGNFQCEWNKAINDNDISFLRLKDYKVNVVNVDKHIIYW